VKVISNSSPLISFSALGRLDILQSLYGSIHIPEAVYHEVVVAGQHYTGAAEVSQATWIIRTPVTNMAAVTALHHLGRGEAEAITLAVEHSGSLLILDDRLGRLVAGHMRLDVIGTLGILLLAKQKGQIPSLATAIDDLQTRLGFRIGTALRASVLREAGEHA
jgi:predicted nucleic acid-binding protein